MLWFIQMLPAYFLFTRLTRKIPKWFMFPVICILQAIPFVHTDRMIIDEYWERYAFFYAGYAFAPFFFQFAALVQKHVKIALVGLAVWAIINSLLVNLGLAPKPFIGLALGLIGAMAIITIGALAERARFARWIRYLGRNSIVVYLAFYWPMKFAAYLLVPIAFISSSPGLFTVIITALGLLGSLSIYWLINWRTEDKWLFRRPAWASIKPGQAS